MDWKKNKWIRRAAIAVAVIFVLFIGLLLARPLMLKWALQKTDATLTERYQVKLIVGEADMEGFTGVSMKNIVLLPLKKDTLFTCENLKIKVRFWPLLVGKIRPASLEIQNASARLIRKDGSDNFSMFFRRKKEKDTTSAGVDYSRTADRILDLMFGYIPRYVKGEKLSLLVSADSINFNAVVSTWNIEDHEFSSEVLLMEKDRAAHFNFSGEINSGDRKVSVTMKVKEGSRFELPLLNALVGLKSGFQQIDFSLEEKGYKNDQLQIEGNARVQELFMAHAKLAPEEIQINKAGIDYKIKVGKREVELDSTSKAYIADWSTFLYFNYQRDLDRQVNIGVYSPPAEAQKFFDAMPEGMFSNLSGMKVNGKLEYRMKLSVRLNLPDSIHFYSELKRDKFTITKFGKTPFTYINSDFQLPVYSRGAYVRTLNVSSSNPYFVPYANIPDKIKYCVLTSEDGSFMWHRGFNMEAFEKSIRDNLKAGRFKRGGSTISMQLVKNIFLSKNKTVSRKLEEIIIVWLIENMRLVSKERMLEIYFNIIEWGPGIYGIGEASEYYFNKKPSELTWNECVFLTSIIPSPKNFKWSFDDQGRLREHLQGYYRLLSGIMVSRGQMTEEEKNNLKPDITLTGRAKELLVIKDTTAAAPVIPGELPEEEE